MSGSEKNLTNDIYVTIYHKDGQISLTEKEWNRFSPRYKVPHENYLAEYSNGAKTWYVNHVRHREDGPAHIPNSHQEEWYQYGKRHRIDGPALINSKPGVPYVAQYFVCGEKVGITTLQIQKITDLTLLSQYLTSDSIAERFLAEIALKNINKA
jgi:hypothetical protein